MPEGVKDSISVNRSRKKGYLVKERKKKFESGWANHGVSFGIQNYIQTVIYERYDEYGVFYNIFYV